MKLKKIIAAVSAATMLITNAITTTTYTAANGTGFPSPFENYVDADCIPVGDYTVEGAVNVIYHVESNGADSSTVKLRTADASDGARSLRLRAGDTQASGTALCAGFTVEFGEEIKGETYEVSFDAWREFSDWRDYAAINYEGWDGKSRLTGTTKWTVEELGVGSEIGGVGSGTWSRYTASFTTDLAPQINFAVAGWGELHLDNIIVKDSSGTVVFADSFETSGPTIGVVVAPVEPEEPGDDSETGFKSPFEPYVGELVPVGEYAVKGAENVIYHIRTNGADNSIARVRTEDASDGARSLRIRSSDTQASGTTLCTEFTVEFGEEIKGETYEVSFDAWREVSDWRDYAALNYEGWDKASRLTGTTKWTVEELGVGSEIGGVGSGTWSRYTASFTTDLAPQINFAVAGWGELHLDNIIVKDSSGAVVFAESFETSGPTIGSTASPEDPEDPEDPDPTPTPTPDEPGDDGETGYKFPFEDYIDEYIPAGDYTVAGTKNVIYHVRNNGEDTSVSIVRTADASDGARSFRIRSKDTDRVGKTLCTEFTLKFGNQTDDGKYVISFDLWREVSSAYDYAALNYDGWDGPARLTDTTKWDVEYLGKGQDIGGVGEGEWSRYTATLKTIADDPQLNFAVAGRGELHIDNIIVKDTSGNLLFAESFEESGPTINNATLANPEEPGDDGEEGFPFPFEDYIDEYIPVGDYTVEGTKNVIYHVRNNGEDTSVSIVRTADASDGKRSFRIRGKDTDRVGKTLCTEFTIKFGSQTADGKYVISFDLWREVSSAYDYAALNYDGWDGPARLTDTTKWDVEYLGKGQDIGGVGTGEWSRYTAKLSTIADDPQLNFAVAGRGELHIDNIIVKDTSGNLLFAESFETSGPTINNAILADPNEPEVLEGTRFPFAFEGYVEQKIDTASTFMVKGTKNVEYSFEFDSNGSPDAKLREADASNGTRSMRIRGTDTTSRSRGLGALFTIKFGNQTDNGKYIISFDLYRELSSKYDYAALNYDGWDGPARLTGTTKWKVKELGKGKDIGGVGEGTWSRYTATLSTIADDPQLNFAVANGGELHIDNIIVKDTSGKVIFAESFEDEGPIIDAELIPSIIRDAEFVVVEKNGDNYDVVGAASKLNANTIVKASVKFENYLVEDGISGKVYTALYRDDILVASDMQKVTANVDSEVSSSAIINIPDLDDGVYALKVFVWDDDLNALKDVMAIGE